jgi:hypothetical protein
MHRIKGFSIAIVVLLVTISSAHATVLIFQPATGSFGNDDSLPAGYGDRVTATTQNGFLYGLGGGTTPNVVTSYGAAISTWDNDFGDLFHVVYAEGDNSAAVFEMDLKADAGFLVKLNSFDMAAWPHLDYTINSVQVLNGSDVQLYGQSNVLIQGDPNGPQQHTHFDFTGVEGQTLKIIWDATNVDSDDVGITNINFSQAPETPVPSTLVMSSILAGMGVAADGYRRRKTFSLGCV